MVISTCNEKGGVGKTTIAVNLAQWFHRRGKSIAFLDTDRQRSATKWLEKINASFPRHHTVDPNQVMNLVPELAGSHDVVFVDTPGNNSELCRLVMLVSDLVLLPCGPSSLDLETSAESFTTLATVQKMRKGPPKAWFIPNRVQMQYRLSGELLDAAQQLGAPVAPAVKLRQAIADAPGQNLTIWEMESRSAQDCMLELEETFNAIFANETTTPIPGEQAATSDGGSAGVHPGS